jgi:hypothetical protein
MRRVFFSGPANAAAIASRIASWPGNLRDAHAPVAHANGLVVLTLAGDKISAITRLGDNSLFPHFGLAWTLRD